MRLQMSEIEQLSTNGWVTESINFSPNHKLVYSIQSDETVNTISGLFESNEIVIRVPTKIARDWCKSEKVSLEINQAVDEAQSLKLLLEKDFKCLRKREGEGDMFPNPNEDHA